MAELWFYELGRSELEETLPTLLERCLARGWRALVRGGVEERLAALDEALWTYREESFLPHGREGEGEARQPILLARGPGNPNGAQALFLIDGAEEADVSAYERASFMFDGRDEAAKAQARDRWRAAKAAGVTVSFWQEKAKGKWEKQA